jgi:16S rRNA G1207 methylase RsmC
MTINPGDRVLDLGCGCGTNGLFAAQMSGPDGKTVLADSNLRAVELARHNAEANGLPNCEALGVLVTDRGPDGWQDALGEGGFDVVLVNPPYFGQAALRGAH